MLNKNDRKEIAGKLKALFPKASDSGREQLLNLLINCCCIDLCSISNQADDIQFTGLTLLGNTLSLTLTINGVPTTQVVNLPTQISTTLVNNGDGTFTYTNESNVVTTIDVATLLVDAGISDGFVNNNDGTLTHAAIDGTVVTFDINDLLLTTTPLFTVNAGTTSVSTDASLGSQVITYGDILHFWSNGSLNFNVQAGSVVVGIDTEADIIPYTPTTLASTNVGDALDELAANSHNPTTLTNTAAPFSWNVSTQAGNIPLTPTLTDNGDGTITYNPNNGVAPITIDTRENSTEVVTTAPITINGTLYPIGTSVQTVLTALTAASHLATTVDVTSNPALTVNLATQAIKLDLDVNGSYNNSGTTLVATSVQDAITELAATSHPLTILTNNAAPFSWNTTTQAGNIPVSPTLVNNGNGTITFTSGTGTAPVTIDVTEDASEVLTTTPITINGTTYPANTAVETILSAISTYAGTTNLTYTPSATNGTIVSDTGTDAVIPSVTLTDAGLATPAMLTNSHVPVSSINSSITIVQSGVNSQTLKADITGIATATSGQVASTDGAGNIVWTTPSSGVTDLTYTPSATNGIVVSSTGTDATISAVDNTNAGLATPAMLLNSHVPATFNDSGTIDFTVSGTDNQTVTATLLGVSGATIGQVPQSDGAGNITWVTPTSATNLTYTASPTQGTVLSDTGTDAIIPSVTVTDAGLATPSLLANSHVPVTTTAGTVTITQSGMDNQTLKADITGISGATTGQVPSKDALGNITWITPAGGATITADNGLTETLGNIQLGGTLLHDTTVTQGSNKLVFERFALELVNTTKSILGLTGVNFVGEYTEDVTNFGPGVTAYFFNGVLSDGSGNTAVVIGKETVGGTYTRTTQILAGNEVMTISTDGNVTTTVEISTNTGFLTNVSDISGSATSIEHSTNRWMASIVGTGYQHSVQLLPQGLLYSNGNLPSSYLFPTADGANGEVMMTNGLGVVSFEPTTNIVANEWHTTGNAGTDGGATNFLGTTDAQDLVLKADSKTFLTGKPNGAVEIGGEETLLTGYPYPVATTEGAVAIGAGSNATNIGSIAIGAGASSTTSNGTYSLSAMGSTVLADYSTAIGESNYIDISSQASYLYGQNNIANAASNASYAFGSANTFTGSRASTLIGLENTASLDSAYLFGHQLRNSNAYEWVLGKYNSITGTPNRLFSIGNGYSQVLPLPNIYRNALTMWKDGRSMWNGDVAKTNTWIGVNGTNPQNFINVTTPTGALAAISTEHTPSGNYAVLGSNNDNSGLVINNTKQFAFTTTADTTSTALGATTTVANYSNTGFLFGGGGVATSTVDVNGTLGLSNTRISTANPVLTTNNIVYHFTAGTTGTVDMTAMVVDNRTFVLTNYSGVSLTLSNAVRTGSATTTTTLTDNTSMTIAYDGVEFFKIA